MSSTTKSGVSSVEIGCCVRAISDYANDFYTELREKNGRFGMEELGSALRSYIDRLEDMYSKVSARQLVTGYSKNT